MGRWGGSRDVQRGYIIILQETWFLALRDTWVRQRQRSCTQSTVEKAEDVSVERRREGKQNKM